MERKKINYKLLLLLSMAFVFVGAFTIFQQTQTEVRAIKEEKPFITDVKDALFRVEGRGDLIIGAIRKVDGSANPNSQSLGFCMSQGKAFPQPETLYSNIMDPNSPEWTWDLVDGKEISKEAKEAINRAMFAYNFVYEQKLPEYGLDPQDTLSLYHATQLVAWTHGEGWRPEMIVKKQETIDNPQLNALADKIYKLYLDIYNYSNNPASETFTKGTSLLDVTNNKAAELKYDLTGGKTYRAENGVVYYRSNLMRLRPNQLKGYVWDGDFAFTYKVTLENAPVGSRIVNENGAEQNVFSTKPGVGSDFYIEVPENVQTAGELTVRVQTVEFRRMEAILWKPISSTAYQPLMQTAAKPDDGSATFTVVYPQTEVGKYGQVEVLKKGEQIKTFVQENSAYLKPDGTPYILNKPVFEVLPLKGTEFTIHMGRDKAIIKGTDGKNYYRGGKLMPSPVGHEGFPTNETGKVIFTNLPLDKNSDTITYLIKEVKNSYGFTLGTEIEKTVTVTKDSNAVVSFGNTEYVNQRIKFQFEVNKANATIERATQRASKSSPAHGVVFGIFNTDTITAYDGTTLAADSLLDVIITNQGKATYNGSLPVGHKYYIKEIQANDGYVADTNRYYIDATKFDGTSELVTITLQDSFGNPVSNIINYPEKYKINIKKEVQIIDQIKKSPNINDLLTYVAETDGNSYEFGIYSDKECANLLEKVNLDSFSNDHIFISQPLYNGTYYVKELSSKPNYTINPEVFTVNINNGDANVTIKNDLEKGKIVINKFDITYNRKDPLNAPVMPGVKFNLIMNGEIIDYKTTDQNGVVTFENLPRTGTYLVQEVIPNGYVSNSEKFEVTLNKEVETVRVENYLSEIKGSIVINKTDTNGKPLEGVQFSIYDVTDKEFKNPLVVDITNAEGKITFANLANKQYVVKETKAKAGYILNTQEFKADLTSIKNGDVMNINVQNELYYGNIKLKKVDSVNNTKLLSGAKYGLYDSNNKLIEEKITDSNGEIIFSKQPYGSVLTVKEIEAPNGYYLSDEVFNVTINDTNKTFYEIVAKDVKYQFDLIVQKLDEKTNKPLANAEFKLYYSNDHELKNALFTLITNDKGEATIKDLPLGNYILVETKAPANYIKYDKEIPLDITNELSKDKVLVVKVYNKKEELPPVIIPPEPKIGNLEITKIVKEGDKTREFNFTVVLDDNTVNGQYGDMAFEKGISKFVLKDAEVKTIKGLKEGISYTVLEESLTDYDVNYNGNTGIIKANTTNKAVIENIKKPDPGTPLIPLEPSTPVEKPGTPLIPLEPSTPVEKPGTPLIPLEPSTPVEKPGTPLIPLEPSTPVEKPGTPLIPLEPAEPVSKVTDLVITKTVEKGDKEKAFEFELFLNDTSINGNYGDITVADGKATFTLKDGESKIAKGLPVGVEYVIREKTDENYDVKAEGNTGVLTENVKAEAKFINILKDKPAPEQPKPEQPKPDVKPPVITEKPQTGVGPNIVATCAIISIISGISLFIYAIYMKEQEKDDTFYF